MSDLKHCEIGRACSQWLYDGTRRGETTFLRILALADQFKVSSDKEGVLQIEGMKNQSGELKRWREIAPLVYREIDGLERIGFRRDDSGNIAELLPFPAIYEGQRVPWYAGKTFIGFLVGGSLLLALLTVLLWPVAVIIRKRYQRPLFSTKSDRVLYFLSRIVCLAEVLFVLAPIVMLSQGLEHIVILGDAINPWLQAYHFVGWVLMAGVVLLVFAAVRFVSLTGAWALVSCPRNSVSDWRSRIRIVCMAIPFSRCVAEVLIGAAHR